tara:strand:- start:5370 stop:5741 length:372 start_codon:yes stop_codon:yes gene_type:complete
MKTTILAAAMFTLASGAVSAAAIDVAGQTLSIGGEVDANYTTGTEVFAMDFTQSVGVEAWGVDFSVEHELDLLKLNETGFDYFNGVALEAGYTLAPGLRTYGKVGMDNDFDFGDITVGTAFAF